MKIKYFLLLTAFGLSIEFNHAQNQQNLVEHYKAYYAQMQKQGDVDGVINAMTHLLVLEPNVARQDTPRSKECCARRNYSAKIPTEPDMKHP